MTSSTQSSRLRTILGACALAAASALSAHATLLTSTYEAQLETWLGQGNLNFGNIFTSVAGDGQTSYNFHAAANGQGPTFSLLLVTSNNTGTQQIIGGYNPQSWSSSSNYNYASGPAATAFIFNLTDGTLQMQKNGGAGIYQTYNNASYGPTFGGGHDIYVSTNLFHGYAYNYSYGATLAADDILSGGGNYQGFTVQSLEVYTFTAGPAAVSDDTATLPLAGFALLGLIALRRRRA